ncbi:gll0118 [Gloeobacter violaceus PCC 7421]|uniref:Gll0118 protein n=2 Tax=Gloeobacter violaceus TaxID=33072 RepID=Q7NPD7_GLOVI|nr:gll0118 [Gloeobacter violaceus PCC 7421]
MAMAHNRNFTEEAYVLGNQLVDKVKEAIQEGNVRRILIQDPQGKTLLEIPLNIGVAAGAGLLFFAPLLAGVAGVAAVVSRAKVVIERYEDPAAKKPTGNEPRPIQIEDEDDPPT